MTDTNLPDRIRAFVALPLPGPVLAGLRDYQRALIARLPATRVRWTPVEQLHVTLRFLGSVPTERLAALEAALADVGRRFPPVRLQVDRVGGFPDLDRPRVVWLGVGGGVDHLRLLQRAVDQASAGFGDPVEERAFSPHLTLGRVKTPAGRELRRIGEQVRLAACPDLGEWEVARIELMSSELSEAGAVHRCLAKIPLQG